MNGYPFWGSFSLGMLFVLLSILSLCLKTNEYKIIWAKNYRFFFIYICFFSVIISITTNFFEYEGVLLTFVRAFGFIISFGYAIKFLDKELTFQYYKKIVFFSITFFFLQHLVYFSTKIVLSGLIPFLPNYYDSTDALHLLSDTDKSIRFASFFIEPSYFAQYIIPYLVIILWEKNTNYRYYQVGILIVTLFLSQSGTGIFLLISVVFMSVVLLLKRLSAIKKLLLASALLIIVPLFAVLVLMTSAGRQLYERNIEINPDKENVTSGFIRIYRGYYLFNELSPFNKLVGVGQGNLRNLIENKSSEEVKFMFYDEIYVNMFQQILITSGLIGVILFLIAHFKFYLLCNNLGKVLLFTLFILMFLDAIYYTPIMLLYLVFAILNLKSNFKKI